MGGFSAGNYSRYYNWTNDAANSINIRADRMDTEDNGFATGLSTCLLKDGTQTVTANIPFAGFRLTGVGAASALTDAIQAAQVQNSGLTTLGTVAGTNTITANTTPSFAAYINGQVFGGIAANTNTSVATLNINGLGAINIKKQSPNGLVALAPGDIISGGQYNFLYDGTEFQLLNPTPILPAIQGILSTGSSNAYVATPPSPWLTGYSGYVGQSIVIKPNFTNNATSTLNVSGLGAVSIYKNVNGSGVAINSGDIVSGVPAILICDGVSFLLVNPTLLNASSVPIVPTTINGNFPSSITGTHTTASMTVGAGIASDSTNAVYINGAGYSWAASNGNAINGTDAGSSTLANSTTYHMFLCSGASGTGTFASASLTPTFPTGYATYNRRIFSFNTNVSGAPIPYTAIEIEGGSLLAWLTTQVFDINVSNLGTSRIAYALTVPTGIKVQPIGRAITNTGTNVTVIMTSGDETDVAPAAPGSLPMFDLNCVSNTAGLWTGASQLLTTNTSGQIGARASTTSVNFYYITRGFKDFRRN